MLLTECSMKAEDIENYLSQLGRELLKRGIQEPVHVLLIGGAYMLLASALGKDKIMRVILQLASI